jgi:RNA polymerase sigma factor (sigma-70 family)
VTNVPNSTLTLQTERPTDGGIEDMLVSSRAASSPDSDVATRTAEADYRSPRQASSRGGATAPPLTAGADPVVMHSRATGMIRGACLGQRKHNLGRHMPRGGDDVTMLLTAAARGDQRAWSLLVRRYSPTIWAVGRRYRLNAADQEDVAQRTWLSLLQHIERVREPTALGSWLATVASRECLQVLAASQRECLVEEPLPPDHVDDSPTLDDVAAESENRAALHAALNLLPCHQREIMRALLAKPGSSYDELSATLGIPRGSIGPTRARCITRLRRDPHLTRAIGAQRPEQTSAPTSPA